MHAVGVLRLYVKALGRFRLPHLSVLNLVLKNLSVIVTYIFRMVQR